MVASIHLKIRLFLCHIKYKFMKESNELLIAFDQEGMPHTIYIYIYISYAHSEICI